MDVVELRKLAPESVQAVVIEIARGPHIEVAASHAHLATEIAIAWQYGV